MHRYRQLHLWISEHDYSLLRDLAGERHETLSSVIRRLIKMQGIPASPGLVGETSEGHEGSAYPLEPPRA